jgi:putative DNA primase/helicase
VKSHIDIVDENYFEQTRIYYKELCFKINKTLESRGLAGTADPTCWSAARLARMPNTFNKKKDKEDAKSYTLNPTIEDVGFNFIVKSGVPLLTKEDQLDKNFMRGYPSPDAKEILSERGCGFLAACKEKPNEVTEELWYAMLGILDWLPNGRATAHEYSRGYKGYSADETDRKSDQAKSSAGARTCKNINTLWGKCGSCPHFNKITSPVQIRGKDFIVTEKSGFWSFKQTKDGIVVLNKPEVMDLVKYFKREHEFISVPETQELFLYNGKHWEEKHISYLLIYAKEHFNPYVNTSMYEEFKKNVMLTNVVQRDWFQGSTAGKFNMQNGVFDMQKGELVPHNRDFGFTHILPYDYDPSALCPAFNKFLAEITANRVDLQNVLLEYTGYSLSNEDSWLQKALFLEGGGANGKSKFTEVVRALAGANNVSSQRLERLGSPIVNAMLENKLVNISDEAGSSAFFASEEFKEIVTGGHMTIKKLYKNQYEIENRTKFIMLCNGLPNAADGSHGFFRRLIIVPFDVQFDEATRDPFILDKLLVELSGIFNLVLQHLRNLKARGIIFESEHVKNALGKYALESDIALPWIQDTLELTGEADHTKWVATTDIYQEYVQNCAYDWGIKPVSSVKFWKKADKVFRKDMSTLRARSRRGDKVVWTIKGLVRKELQDEQF